MNETKVEPLPFDPEAPRCRAHRHIPPGQPVDCQACVEAVRWVERRRVEQQARDAQLLRECPMCDVTGQRWDPDTHVPVSPRWTCDHDTPHADVLEEIQAFELAAEAAREKRPAPPPVPSTPSGRARARAMFRPCRPRVPLPAQRAVVDPVGREQARRELVAASAVSTSTGGLEEPQSGSA